MASSRYGRIAGTTAPRSVGPAGPPLAHDPARRTPRRGRRGLIDRADGAETADVPDVDDRLIVALSFGAGSATNIERKVGYVPPARKAFGRVARPRRRPENVRTGRRLDIIPVRHGHVRPGKRQDRRFSAGPAPANVGGIAPAKLAARPSQVRLTDAMLPPPRLASVNADVAIGSPRTAAAPSTLYGHVPDALRRSQRPSAPRTGTLTPAPAFGSVRVAADRLICPFAGRCRAAARRHRRRTRFD